MALLITLKNALTARWNGFLAKYKAARNRMSQIRTERAGFAVIPKKDLVNVMGTPIVDVQI